MLHFGGGGDGAGPDVHFVAEFVTEDVDGGCGVFHGDDGEGEFGEEGEEGFFPAGFCGAELPDFLDAAADVDAVDGGFCEGGEVVGTAGVACAADELFECLVFGFGEVDIDVFSHDFSSFLGGRGFSLLWFIPDDRKRDERVFFPDSPFLYILSMTDKYTRVLYGALLFCFESVRDFFRGGGVFFGFSGEK